MPKFKFTPIVPTDGVITSRVGTTGAKLVDNDKGKFVKLAADSQYNLCAAGNPIEGVFVALEAGTQDGFAIGSVATRGRVEAICDGLQATPGTGTIAVGDYVVCGTVTAAGTALTVGVKVCKATNQPGTAVSLADNVVATINAGLAKVAEAQANLIHAWRVVSLGNAGAVGDTCVIERVNAVK